MTTNANVKRSDSSHWYATDGTPVYEMPNKSKGGMRPTTLNDARRLNLVPSVTTILKILHKQGLVDWLIEQACLSVLTTPKLDGEQLDAFVERVLHTERVQDQESQAARDRGTEIHDGLECYFTGREVPEAIKPWIMPAAQAIATRGELVAAEKILVGHGYAGKTDLIQRAADGVWWLWDWKSAKKLPDPTKGAWQEHVLQLSAYADAYFSLVYRTGEKDIPIRTGNVYISTIEQGKFCVCEHDDWVKTYSHGFAPLVRHWQWSNSYEPEQPVSGPHKATQPTRPKNVVWTEGVRAK